MPGKVISRNMVKQLDVVAGKEAAHRLNKAAEYLRSKIAENISEPTRVHGASLPHEFPHADTGTLRNSLVVEPATPKRLSAQVGSNLEYALYLEEGTKDKEGNTRMEPRPFIERTYDEEKDRLTDILRRGV